MYEEFLFKTYAVFLGKIITTSYGNYLILTLPTYLIGEGLYIVFFLTGDGMNVKMC